MTKLHLQFDATLDYQTEAVQAVVEIFEGIPRQATAFGLQGNVRPNMPAGYALDEIGLLTNLQYVQDRFPPSDGARPNNLHLEVDEGTGLDWTGVEAHRHPSFTVEMETGTGKTYVYMRTIHELYREYGFRKYIIVVPSIAIFEGVVKTFDITRSHFAALYGNPTVHMIRFDGERLSDLRTFADSPFIEIMVVTLDSFNRNSNKVFKPSEQLPGEWLPYQYIQAARPILILDEPQNMGTELSKKALRSLHPLFALRYSATHKEAPNLVYRLTPFEAFQRGLVKRIEVHGVTTQDYLGKAGIVLLEIGRNPFSAKVRVSMLDKGAAVEKEIVLGHGHDLFLRTKHPEYRQYGHVTEINAADGFVEFSSGDRFTVNDMFGGFKRDIFRVQIERTVETHMQRQAQLVDMGIKVLSLFFIDRVANYVAADGIIRILFEEAYVKYAPQYGFFRDKPVGSVHDGYFARTKAKAGQRGDPIDTGSNTAAERELEKAAFALIMRDKEQLLSLDEDLCFIFAHSALKEGWDNPNVFQICTLNQTKSEPKKRQEIGRGLRIPVNQTGQRVFDEDVARLTVVANESYETYVRNLQNDYREDGQAQPPAPSNARTADADAQRRDEHYQSEAFRQFWEQLVRRTDYRIRIDTDALVSECVARLNLQQFPEPRIVVQVGEYVQSKLRFTLQRVASDGRAHLDIQIVESRNAGKQITKAFELGADLAKDKDVNDERVKDFMLTQIDKRDGSVTFANGVKLYLNETAEFSTEEGQVVRVSSTAADVGEQSVFDLLSRAAEATNLTKRTLLSIFQGLTEDRQRLFLRNPEVFAGRFIRIISQQLSRHIAERIEFVVSSRTTGHKLDELFPPVAKFLQREMVEAGANGVYDKVQTDSNIERNFVAARLRDNGQVLMYFKFPAKYRISFPKAIGNYNPDWGVLWRNGEGQEMVSLVRETKGSEDVRLLQWEHEKRKIEVARRHFAALGIDYRTVTDTTAAWWEAGPDQLPLEEESVR